jgi:hypothetical protein
LKKISILALVLAAGTAFAQNDPATVVGNDGPREPKGTVIGQGWDMGGGSGTRAVIHDTLHFADNQTYDQGNGNAYSGQGAFGAIYDLQLSDDFSTTSDSTLTRVTGDYVCFFGQAPANGLQVDVWTNSGCAPGTLVASQTVPVSAASSWTDTIFGLAGVRLTGDVNIPLTANTSYFIMIQPIDLSSSGDWYYQIRDNNSFNGCDSYGRDGGRGNAGYGTFNWTSMANLGFGAGDAGMRVEAEGGGPNCDPADFNNDGVVDTRDVLAFLNTWSACR